MAKRQNKRVRIRCRVERNCYRPQADDRPDASGRIRNRLLKVGDETIYEGDPDRLPSWMTPLKDLKARAAETVAAAEEAEAAAAEAAETAAEAARTAESENGGDGTEAVSGN